MPPVEACYVNQIWMLRADASPPRGMPTPSRTRDRPSRPLVRPSSESSSLAHLRGSHTAPSAAPALSSMPQPAGMRAQRQALPPEAAPLPPAPHRRRSLGPSGSASLPFAVRFNQTFASASHLATLLVLVRALCLQLLYHTPAADSRCSVPQLGAPGTPHRSMHAHMHACGPAAFPDRFAPTLSCCRSSSLWPESNGHPAITRRCTALCDAMRPS